jgi:hypothetical protein
VTASLRQKCLGLVVGAVLASLPVLACAAPILHGPDEVLESFCSVSEGRLYFSPPTGGRWELVSSTGDPAILNPGDGAFHAMPLATVAEALAALDFPLDDLSFHVYVLPYPRRAQLHSAAGDGSLYLAPGTYPYADAVVHGVVAHEVGHIVHRTYLPDADDAGWEAYASLRGFYGDARYSETAPHAFRPREVFAEDFRALFGSALARESGSLENPELVWPEEVEGLEAFVRSLPERQVLAVPLIAWPNPFRDEVRFRFRLPESRSPAPGATPATGAGPSAGGSSTTESWWLAIYDARGRRVRSLPAGSSSNPTATVRWDGRDARGSRVPPGTYLARLAPLGGASQGALSSRKLVLLP